MNNYFLRIVDDDLLFPSDHGPQGIRGLRLVELLHILNGRAFLFGGEVTTKKVVWDWWCLTYLKMCIGLSNKNISFQNKQFEIPN